MKCDSEKTWEKPHIFLNTKHRSWNYVMTLLITMWSFCLKEAKIYIWILLFHVHHLQLLLTSGHSYSPVLILLPKTNVWMMICWCYSASPSSLNTVAFHVLLYSRYNGVHTVQWKKKMSTEKIYIHYKVKLLNFPQQCSNCNTFYSWSS